MKTCFRFQERQTLKLEKSLPSTPIEEKQLRKKVQVEVRGLLKCSTCTCRQFFVRRLVHCTCTIAGKRTEFVFRSNKSSGFDWMRWQNLPRPLGSNVSKDEPGYPRVEWNVKQPSTFYHWKVSLFSIKKLAQIKTITRLTYLIHFKGRKFSREDSRTESPPR